MLFKSKSNNKIKESSEITKLKKEYENCKNKFGEGNAKTLYFDKRISLQNAVENIKKQMSKAEFHSAIMEYSDTFEGMLSINNVDKKFQNFKHKVMSVASKLFAEDYTSVDIICATSLFMYFIDAKIYDNTFKNDNANIVFKNVGVFSTGESMTQSSFDSENGFYEVFRMLLDYGFDITEDLEYCRIIPFGDKQYLEVVNVEDAQIIPYHLFNNNCKQFKKALKSEDNQISNSTFIDFTASIPKVKDRVINAVSEFWNIDKLMHKMKLVTFNNTQTLNQLHLMIDKYLVRNLKDTKNPILSINEKYISARKLLEYILVKNNINYTLNQDLLYEDQYYLKIDFDEDTIVKYTPYSILDEDFSLKDIKDYVSANAFENDLKEMTSAFTSKYELENNNLGKDDISDKINESNFTPDNSYDVMLQILEHKNANKMKENKFALDENNENFEEFENTTPIDFNKAQEEQNELDKSKIERIDDKINTADQNPATTINFDDKKTNAQNNIDNKYFDYDDDWLDKELESLNVEEINNSFEDELNDILDVQPQNDKKEINDNENELFFNLDLNKEDLKVTQTPNTENEENKNEIDNILDNTTKNNLENIEDNSNEKTITNEYGEEMVDMQDIINYGKPHEKSPDIIENEELINNDIIVDNLTSEEDNINEDIKEDIKEEEIILSPIAETNENSTISNNNKTQPKDNEQNFENKDIIEDIKHNDIIEEEQSNEVGEIQEENYDISQNEQDVEPDILNIDDEVLENTNQEDEISNEEEKIVPQDDEENISNKVENEDVIDNQDIIKNKDIENEDIENEDIIEEEKQKQEQTNEVAEIQNEKNNEIESIEEFNTKNEDIEELETIEEFKDNDSQENENTTIETTTVTETINESNEPKQNVISKTNALIDNQDDENDFIDNNSINTLNDAETNEQTSPFNAISYSNSEDLEPQYNPYNSLEYIQSMENGKIIYPDFAELPSTRSVIEEKNAEIKELESEITKVENEISQIELQNKLAILEKQRDELIATREYSDVNTGITYQNEDDINEYFANQDENENEEISAVEEENNQEITNSVGDTEIEEQYNNEEELEEDEENTTSEETSIIDDEISEENTEEELVELENEEKKIVANINELILPPIPPRKNKKSNTKEYSNSDKNISKKTTANKESSNSTHSQNTPDKLNTQTFLPPIPPRRKK